MTTIAIIIISMFISIMFIIITIIDIDMITCIIIMISSSTAISRTSSSQTSLYTQTAATILQTVVWCTMVCYSMSGLHVRLFCIWGTTNTTNTANSNSKNANNGPVQHAVEDVVLVLAVPIVASTRRGKRIDMHVANVGKWRQMVANGPNKNTSWHLPDVANESTTTRQMESIMHWRAHAPTSRYPWSDPLLCVRDALHLLRAIHGAAQVSYAMTCKVCYDM